MKNLRFLPFFVDPRIYPKIFDFGKFGTGLRLPTLPVGRQAQVGYTTKTSAVRGGFEPPVPLRVRQFSKLLVSATHPPHHAIKNIFIPQSGAKV